MKPNKEIILEGYRGSISMGMYMKNWIDDKDIFGVFVPPIKNLYGLHDWDCYERKEGEMDELYYSIRKFIQLALKGNPNTLCLLWLRPEYYIKITKWGQALIDNRDIFTGRHCYHSFTGYAYGQLNRMTHFKFEGYMGEKRKTLVEKFGYDTKNASHLIRLLKMGVEYLTEGNLNVFREDNQQLLAIKRGEWTLEQIKEKANELFKLAEEAYVRSPLPTQPDYEKAEELLINITKEFNDAEQGI